MMRVLVLGAGVAGLQAIATARRLGGVVYGYDVRPACREQVESLGAKFVELALDSKAAEDKGGYAKSLDEDFYQRQRELLAKEAALADVIVTTAAIPGKPSPRLITAAAVAGMHPGSVIVDLAAERVHAAHDVEAFHLLRHERDPVQRTDVVRLGLQQIGDVTQRADRQNHHAAVRTTC